MTKTQFIEAIKDFPDDAEIVILRETKFDTHLMEMRISNNRKMFLYGGGWIRENIMESIIDDEAGTFESEFEQESFIQAAKNRVKKFEGIILYAMERE